ncbi:hypothetical protein VW41_17065 [Klebsiella michiganensis]|nr:hypothetical protein VW41_17065 [Klebsiella michiganensis]
MSYIDSIKHELVGFFNGLPVYHPLETVEGESWGSYYFSCSPANLIIGGGAGEHPALVLHNLESLVAAYLLHAIEQDEVHFAERYSPPPDHTRETLFDIFLCEKPALEFCGWSMKQIHDFVELAKSPLHASPLKADQSPEEWIKISIGEFIYFSLSELNPLAKEMATLEGIEQPGYWLRNVTCPPPNYVKSKKESLASDDAFKLCGYFRWDYVYPPEE